VALGQLRWLGRRENKKVLSPEKLLLLFLQVVTMGQFLILKEYRLACEEARKPGKKETSAGRSRASSRILRAPKAEEQLLEGRACGVQWEISGGRPSTSDRRSAQKSVGDGFDFF